MTSLIVKLHIPYKIVEIGTCTGYTTAILAKNSHDKTRLVSVDLPTGDCLNQDKAISNEALLNNWVVNDNCLRQRQGDAGELYINSFPSSYSDKIRLIKADSSKLAPGYIAHLAQAVLFIIDGGHSLETERSDTGIALASIISSGLIYGMIIAQVFTRKLLTILINHWRVSTRSRIFGTLALLC